MAQKDLAEKQLIAHADIFNSTVFKGKLVLDASKLVDTKIESQLPDLTNDLHSQMRDLAKSYQDGEAKLAIFGIENQTKIDKMMAARIMCYNTATILDQLKSNAKSLYPVLTIVLYFGKEAWRSTKQLRDLFDLSKILIPKEYLPQLKIFVVEVAFLKEKEIAMMKSDFKYVAEMMVKIRENKDYQPTEIQLKHHKEFLRLMDALDRDRLRNFVEFMADSDKKEGQEMKGYLDEIEDKAMAKGISQGIAQGLARGKAEGKIIGAVGALLTMNLDSLAIKAKIKQSYPNLDQKKLDQIIAEQKKELGLN